MSLLKPIDFNFEPVSEQYFIDNEYAYSQYTRKGPMSEHGSWFKTEFMKLEDDIFVSLRFRYSTDTKRFIVEPTLRSDDIIRAHNVIFEDIIINNPSEVDIEVAITEDNLKSRFCKLSDVNFN